jgi:hypothetical protein
VEENTAISPRTAGLKPPWEKGQPSPNPAGRPRGSQNLTTVIERWLRLKQGSLELPDGTKIQLDKEDAAVLAQLKKAIGQNQVLNDKGIVTQNYIEADTSAFNAIMAYRYGKPIQRTENENKEVTEFASEADERAHLLQTIAEIELKAIERSGEIVNEAESIIANV